MHTRDDGIGTVGRAKTKCASHLQWLGVKRKHSEIHVRPEAPFDHGAETLESRNEKMLRKVKSINYENRDCEKFEYVTVINGVEEENEGIKCKTSYGYEVIR